MIRLAAHYHEQKTVDTVICLSLDSCGWTQVKHQNRNANSL